jgi:hypothetical protein
MSKFAATLAALMLVIPASAVAQDFRSPDAKPAAQQDYRSPDAKPIVSRQDYRSPDARLRLSPDTTPNSTFFVAAPVAASPSSDSFDWGLLAAGIALVLIGAGAMTLTQRRRRHGLAVGS